MPDTRTGQFDKLVAPHLPTLFRVAWRLVRNAADAEDLVQDTCVAACENDAALAAANHPAQWLLRVLYNRFIDRARRCKRSPLLPMDEADVVAGIADETPGPEELLQRADDEQFLEFAFLRLDESQRTLLALCAEGYELTEIEAITGIGKEALSARLYRARRRLAQELATQRSTTSARAGSKP
jgi:RNA polymerase sigma-70 factor (ECF subfamily)